MSALIVKRSHRFPDGQLLYAGDELRPGSLDQATIDLLFDLDVLCEVPTRISYFALLPDFAGVEAGSQKLTAGVFPELAFPAEKA